MQVNKVFNAARHRDEYLSRRCGSIRSDDCFQEEKKEKEKEEFCTFVPVKQGN
jgi:hypothetical protein